MSRKYNLEKLTPASDLFGELYNSKAEESNTEEFMDKVLQLPLESLIPYENHKFNIPTGEEWEEFTESIKTMGVLQPIIVRKKDDKKYEIIAGHSRTKAAKEVGLSTIPAIITEADDLDASVLVGITNKQRRDISDVEWGWTYRTTYELLKRQEGRPKKNGVTVTPFSEDDKKPARTAEILAQKYGVGEKTIKRKMRLTYLIDDFIEAMEKKKIKQSVAITLSYLDEMNQRIIYNVMIAEGLRITDEMAAEFKGIQGEIDFTADVVKSILLKGKEEKAVDSESKEFQCKVATEYLPRDLKKSQREDYVTKALKYIWENGIEI